MEPFFSNIAGSFPTTLPKKAPGRSWKYSNISRTFQNSSATLENWK